MERCQGEREIPSFGMGAEFRQIRFEDQQRACELHGRLQPRLSHSNSSSMSTWVLFTHVFVNSSNVRLSAAGGGMR